MRPDHDCGWRERQRRDDDSHGGDGATRSHACALMRATVVVLPIRAVACVQHHRMVHRAGATGVDHHSSKLHQRGLMMWTRSGCRGLDGCETEPDREKCSKHTPDHAAAHAEQYSALT